MPNISLNQGLVIILGVVGLVWYYLCLFSVGMKPSLHGKPVTAYRQFETLSITTISVSLATFVGSLLGVQQAAGEVAEPPPAPATENLVSRLTVSDLQWVCAALYVLSLLIAVVFWHRERDRADPAISNLGKSLLGLVGGALSIALKAHS